MLTLVGVIVVALFCIAVGIRDIRRKEYIWAVLAFGSAVVLLGVAPIPTHAVKLDVVAQTSATSRP
jgi:hypothetical protein